MKTIVSDFPFCIDTEVNALIRFHYDTWDHVMHLQFSDTNVFQG